MYDAYNNNSHWAYVLVLNLKKFLAIQEKLAAEECEETFRNGIIKLAWFCIAPYGAAVTEIRWNSQSLGSPLRQLCSTAAGEIVFAV